MQEVESSGPVMDCMRVGQETSDVVVCLAYHLSVFVFYVQVSIIHAH